MQPSNSLAILSLLVSRKCGKDHVVHVEVAFLSVAAISGSTGAPRRSRAHDRGSTMAYGRHDRRALLLSVAIVVLGSAAGCLRSSFLRPAVEPVLERQDFSDP